MAASRFGFTLAPKPQKLQVLRHIGLGRRERRAYIKRCRFAERDEKLEVKSLLRKVEAEAEVTKVEGRAKERLRIVKSIKVEAMTRIDAR